jgi:hypothetical protein
MSTGWIFVIGTFTFGLCLAFVVISASELRRLGREGDARIAQPQVSAPSPSAE